MSFFLKISIYNCISVVVNMDSNTWPKHGVTVCIIKALSEDERNTYDEHGLICVSYILFLVESEVWKGRPPCLNFV